MTIRELLYYGEIGVGMLAILVTAVVYMRRAGSKRVEQPWFRNPVGQFIVSLCVFAEGVYVRSLIAGSHNFSVGNLVFSGVFTIYFLYMATLLTVILKPRERGQHG